MTRITIYLEHKKSCIFTSWSSFLKVFLKACILKKANKHKCKIMKWWSLTFKNTWKRIENVKLVVNIMHTSRLSNFLFKSNIKFLEKLLCKITWRKGIKVLGWKSLYLFPLSWGVSWANFAITSSMLLKIKNDTTYCKTYSTSMFVNKQRVKISEWCSSHLG